MTEEPGDPCDEALMAAYVAGDLRAFHRLFARLGPRVYAFFMRSFRDPPTADELFQITFLKVHKGRASYRSDSAVRPWVFAIAARVRKDELRRRYRLKEDCDEEAFVEAELAQSLTHEEHRMADDWNTDSIERVRTALEALPESQRVVIHLHRYENMTFHEIARVLGASEVAVRGRAFRGYEQLRKSLLPMVRSRGTS